MTDKKAFLTTYDDSHASDAVVAKILSEDEIIKTIEDKTVSEGFFTMYEESALMEGDLDYLIGKERFKAPTVELIEKMRAFIQENDGVYWSVDDFMADYFSMLCIRFKKNISDEIILAMAGGWIIEMYDFVDWAFHEINGQLSVLKKALETANLEAISLSSFYELVSTSDSRVLRMLVRKFGKAEMIQKAQEAVANYTDDWGYYDRVPVMNRIIGRLKRFKDNAQ